VALLGARQTVASCSGLAGQGTTAALLACTEFGLLVAPNDVELPLYDTARLHVDAAVGAALA
jgi:aspartate racemase